MYAKYRRRFSSWNRVQRRITAHMPSPQFKKWDNSSSVGTSPLRPPPAAWYSFPLEVTTALPVLLVFLLFVWF